MDYGILDEHILIFVPIQIHFMLVLEMIEKAQVVHAIFLDFLLYFYCEGQSHFRWSWMCSNFVDATYSKRLWGTSRRQCCNVIVQVQFPSPRIWFYIQGQTTLR